MAQCYGGFVVLYTWVSNTFPRPPAKRAVAVAFVNAFSQLGNVAGSYVLIYCYHGVNLTNNILVMSGQAHGDQHTQTHTQYVYLLAASPLFSLQ